MNISNKEIYALMRGNIQRDLDVNEDRFEQQLILYGNHLVSLREQNLYNELLADLNMQTMQLQEKLQNSQDKQTDISHFEFGFKSKSSNIIQHFSKEKQAAFQTAFMSSMEKIKLQAIYQDGGNEVQKFKLGTKMNE